MDMETKRFRKCKSKFVILLFVLTICTCSIVVQSYASSYPILYSDLFQDNEAGVGSTLRIKLTYFPEYTNERIHIELYDENEKKVYEDIKECYNSSVKFSNYYINLDTTESNTGKYTLVTYCDFYTYYAWHTVPTKRTKSITLINGKYGWYKENEKWYYYNRSGIKTTGFIKIGYETFFFDGNGVVYGFKAINGNTYYFNKDGTMETYIDAEIDGDFYSFN